MSEPRPPSADMPPIDDAPASTIDGVLTPIGATDRRDINMSRLDSGPSTSDPGVIHLTGPTKGTVVRQPDGSWTFVPEPPPVAPPAPPPVAPPGWSQPALPVSPTGWTQTAAKVGGKSLLEGHGLMATLATLATVGIVGIALASGGDDGGGKTNTFPSAGTSTTPVPTTPIESIDSTGAAEANRIVTEIVKGCLSKADQADMGLIFEAVPDADLDRVLQAVPDHPDRLFIIDRVVGPEVFTVTIAATGGGDHGGAEGQWAVDIKTGGVVPLRPKDGSPRRGGGSPMWGILISHGCGTIQEML